MRAEDDTIFFSGWERVCGTAVQKVERHIPVPQLGFLFFHSAKLRPREAKVEVEHIVGRLHRFTVESLLEAIQRGTESAIIVFTIHKHCSSFKNSDYTNALSELQTFLRTRPLGGVLLGIGSHVRGA